MTTSLKRMLSSTIHHCSDGRDECKSKLLIRTTISYRDGRRYVLTEQALLSPDCCCATRPSRSEVVVPTFRPRHFHVWGKHDEFVAQTYPGN